MALFLTDLARKGIKALDSDSPCAKKLEKNDIENILKDDITRICEAASFTEITGILSLASRLQIASEEKKETIKKELKKIAEEIVVRVEGKSGKLKTPESCRHLLLNL